jgi:hypothetical protein
MPENQDGIMERDGWLLDREGEGFIVKKVSRCVYEINGKKVNIKFAKQRRDNTFWFNTTPKRLEEMDLFVWLCGGSKNYYVISRDKMKQLIDARNWLDKGHYRPEFCISPNREYLPAHINISSYYQDTSPLRDP